MCTSYMQIVTYLSLKCKGYLLTGVKAAKRKMESVLILKRNVITVRVSYPR